MAAGSDAPSRARSRPGARESFFKILDRALSLLVMTGTSRELTISHGAQFPAQCLLGDDDTEFLEDPLAEIDDAPTHDPVNRRDRAALEYRASATRCAPFRRDGCPGGLRSISPSGPWALNFITQSRTICSVTPATFAASVRLAPS